MIYSIFGNLPISKVLLLFARNTPAAIQIPWRRIVIAARGDTKMLDCSRFSASQAQDGEDDGAPPQQSQPQQQQQQQPRQMHKEGPMDWLKNSSPVNDIMFPLSTNLNVPMTDAMMKYLFWVPDPNTRKDGQATNTSTSSFSSSSTSSKPTSKAPILCGFASPQRSKPKFCMLFFHGNGEAVLESQRYLQLAANNLQALVIGMEYPGYPNAPGRGQATESSVSRDALVVFDFIVNELGVPASRVLVYGRSIGSGPAVYLGTKRTFGGLVLEAPFQGIKALASTFVGSIGSLCAERFPNARRLAKIKGKIPIAIVHGSQDEIVPFSHGETNAHAAGIIECEREFLRLDGYGHNNVDPNIIHRWLKGSTPYTQVCKEEPLNIPIKNEYRTPPQCLLDAIMQDVNRNNDQPQQVPAWKQVLRFTPEIPAAIAGIFFR